MPVDVTTEIVIDRPRPVVAAYVSDPGEATGYENIESVRWATPMKPDRTATGTGVTP